MIAFAYVPLEGLASGEKNATLLDNENKEAGSITLNLNVKQVPARIMNLDNIGIEFQEGGDMIGDS